ncbi:hypothetical protein IL306_008859 [Fusarium sp. DS 682]|nr:hypothetical protein IL306_008859 [Fusarium sp. DS 682]
MSNLQNILNPVDNDQQDAISRSFDNYLGPGQEQSTYEDDTTSSQELNFSELFGVGSLDFWGDFNGEISGANNYLQPNLTNALGDPVVEAASVLSSHFAQNNAPEIDPQLGAMDWDTNAMDISQMTHVPTDEQNTPSQMSTVFNSFELLELPTESSREGSSRTPGFSGSSQSNATPLTVPEDDDLMVHFGMLHNIEVKLVPDDMSSIDERLTMGNSAYQYFTPTEYQKQLMLCFLGDEKQFGHLPSAIGQTLMPLITLPNVDIEPLALNFDLREVIHRANKSADARAKVDINIYGRRSLASHIGRILSDGKLWLQRSIHGRHDTVYENPHFLNIIIQDTESEEVQNTQLEVNDGTQKRKSKEDQLRKMVEEVYKTVENNRELEMVEGGARVTRELLRHQKEALGFMLERESGHINEKYRLWEELEHGDGKIQYRHRITKRRRDIRPEERGGGILADDMGMGKSLSILALVMKTLDNGQEWAKEKNEEHKSRRSLKFSRSTLVVVSAACESPLNQNSPQILIRCSIGR